MKKCPPGTLCLETATITLIFVVLVMGVYWMRSRGPQGSSSGGAAGGNNNTTVVVESPGQFQFQPSVPNYPYSSPGIFNQFSPPSVLENPYVPPLKDGRYFDRRTAYLSPPISVNTSAIDAPYRQVGILVADGGGETPLPLMGRPRQPSSSKWQYYTMNTPAQGGIKLPIVVNKKNAMDEYGVDEMYNGDSVRVESYSEPFRVTIYQTSSIQYYA
jgi:hypothetical protein